MERCILYASLSILSLRLKQMMQPYPDVIESVNTGTFANEVLANFQLVGKRCDLQDRQLRLG